MRFQELPHRLRAYVLIQPLLVAPLLIVAARQPLPADGRLFAALLFFTALFSTWKLELTVCKGRMTPVFATVCLAMLLQGATAAIACSAVGALITTFVRPPNGSWRLRILRPRPYYVWFNLMNGALAGLAAALAFQLAAPAGISSEWTAVAALLAFTTAYFLINTLGVAIAIAYQQQLAWHAVWQQNFLWTAPGFFASAAATWGIHALFPWMGAWSLLFLCPLYLIYHSYRVYMDRISVYTDRVQQNVAEIQALDRLNTALMASLARAIEARGEGPDTEAQRLERCARAFALEAGVAGAELEAVTVAAHIYDAGRCPPPEHLPGRPARVLAGAVPSRAGAGGEPSPAANRVVEIVLAQHERWDGQGYPAGLEGEAIPLGARILAIAAMFVMLTSNRPFRRAISSEQALQLLREGAGRQFDPGLVERFAERLPAICPIDEVADHSLPDAALSPRTGQPGIA